MDMSVFHVLELELTTEFQECFMLIKILAEKNALSFNSSCEAGTKVDGRTCTNP